MRTLVLGGAGFVGRHVCADLAAAGHDVVAVVRRPAGRSGAGRAAAELRSVPGVEVDELVHPGVLGLATALRRHGPAVVINAAGAVHRATETSLRESNVDLVADLLQAIAAQAAPPALVQLGTVHEYRPAPEGVALTEDAPTEPSTPYGHAKLLGSTHVLAARQAGAVRAMIIRMSNVVGPGADGSLLESIAARLAAVRDTAGTAPSTSTIELAFLAGVRDFVDVRDVAAAVRAAAVALVTTCAESLPPVVNVGGGTAVPIRALVERLIEISAVPARLVVGSDAVDPDGAPGGPERSDAPAPAGGRIGFQQTDITRARQVLGWTPRIAVEESLHRVWAAHDHRKAAA